MTEQEATEVIAKELGKDEATKIIANRHLTIDEQRIFNQALRDSATDCSTSCPDYNCECMSWARSGQAILTKHHKNCKHYNLESEMKDLLERLCLGIRDWSADCDGVHPACFDVYKEACYRIGRFNWVKEDDE